MATSNIDYSNLIPGVENYRKSVIGRIQLLNLTQNSISIAEPFASLDEINNYIKNPNSKEGLAFEKKFFKYNCSLYGNLSAYGQDTKNIQPTIQDQAQYFVSNRQESLVNIQNEIKNNVNDGVQQAVKAEQRKKDANRTDWVDVVFNVGMAFASAGLSLETQIAVNATTQILNGVPIQDVVRGIVGSVAANQVVGALKDINTQIAAAGPNVIKPEVVAALSNAERQAANAVITKQDVGSAALAGAAGGTVASATSLASDSAAIQRAAGEYAQALAAGKTQEQALTSALSGFLNQQEKDAAKQKVLDTAALGTGQVGALTGDQAGGTTGDQAGGTTGDPTNSLPPVTVTADQELPVQESVGSYTGTEQSQLSLQNKALQTDTKAQPKTSKTNNAILLSLINKPLSRSVPIGSPTQTSSTVGSQALGQALRVGDAGAPVFGGDKDKSKRSGWNTESLRYMGNSGDSNG